MEACIRPLENTLVLCTVSDFCNFFKVKNIYFLFGLSIFLYVFLMTSFEMPNLLIFYISGIFIFNNFYIILFVATYFNMLES